MLFAHRTGCRHPCRMPIRDIEPEDGTRLSRPRIDEVETYV